MIVLQINVETYHIGSHDRFGCSDEHHFPCLKELTYFLFRLWRFSPLFSC
jgi:hypothetical protein